MKVKRIVILSVVLLALLIPARAVLAAPPFDTTVKKGETVNNDVVVFDGDLEVEEGAVVNGDVTVFNGHADIAGTVNGDLVLFNGDLDAADTAVVTGDCVLLNGSLTDKTEDGLNCTDVENLPNFIPALSDLPDIPRFTGPDFETRAPDNEPGFFGNLGAAAGRSLLMGLLAFVVATFAPQHILKVQTAVQRKPIASGAVGVLTAFAVPSLAFLLLLISALLIVLILTAPLGLLGLAVIFLLFLAMAAGGLLGWISIGNVLGQRLADPINLKNRNLATTAALGTAVLTFAIGLLGILPFVFGEGLLTMLVMSVGLGAAALTRFGAKPYPLTDGLAEPEKVTAILETLTIEDPAQFKE